jgi:TorA maturation chaperone TorD
MTTTTPLHFTSPDQGEEIARAELYGLLAMLWLGAPDEALLQQFRTAVTEAPGPGGHLEAPWHDLVAAMRASTSLQTATEYDALFGGVGKPEVFLYGSYYLSGFLNEKPLATLRADLAKLGLTRDDTRGETEDHIAFGFEVMRYLIAGDDALVCTLEQQRRFFRQHLQPWVERLCDAVEAQPAASVWRAAATLTRAFVQVESQAFDMVE